MLKTDYKVQVFDGHTHIDRRVFTNERDEFCCRINGMWFTLSELCTFGDEVRKYYDP